MKNFSVDGDRWKLLLFWMTIYVWNKLSVVRVRVVASSLASQRHGHGRGVCFLRRRERGWVVSLLLLLLLLLPPFDVKSILFVERMKIHALQKNI